jgi:ribosomal protein S7
MKKSIKKSLDRKIIIFQKNKVSNFILKKRILHFLILNKSTLLTSFKLNKCLVKGFLSRNFNVYRNICNAGFYSIFSPRFFSQKSRNILLKYKTYISLYNRSFDLNDTLISKQNATYKYFNLYSTFLNFFIKMGKKSNVEERLGGFLDLVSKKLAISKVKIILLFFLRLNTKVETRVIKIRQRTNTIPFLISIKRQKFLALFWFYKTISASSEKLSLKKKIVSEIVNVLQNKASSILFLEKNNQLAVKHRSNAHYRW